MLHPDLGVFKARLDGFLGSLIWWLTALPMAVGGNKVMFKLPSNVSHAMIL